MPLTHSGPAQEYALNRYELPLEVSEMKLKRRGLLGGFNRFRLMLTLGLAVVLPAAALIYVNFRELSAFKYNKVLEATIHRDFQEIGRAHVCTPVTRSSRMPSSA